MVVEGCPSRQLARMRRGVPKAIRGGQSSDPNESQSLPAAMRAMTTRMLLALIKH
jgi:hypothetical protein